MKGALAIIAVLCLLVVGLTFRSPNNEPIENLVLVLLQMASLWLVISFYFLGFLVALKREHKDAIAIFALNLLTGWTFIGWVISLVWALKTNQEAK